MSDSHHIHQIYLSQLQGLEQFRSQYQSAFATAALDRDDPELKRLTEAIAYCTAHTQQAALSSLRRHEQQLLIQTHPYMATALPAKTIIQAHPDAKMTMRYQIEAGTPFAIQNEDFKTAMFSTCNALALQPVQLSQLDCAPRGLTDQTLRLRFDAFTQMHEAPAELPFYLNVCNDFNATLALLTALQDEETRLEATFDNDTQRIPCTLVFRQPECQFGMHPIETVRNLLHFPYAYFCLALSIKQAPKHWHSFYLNIHLKQHRTLPALSKDCFRLFCTPAINLYQTQAKSIWCDGTRSQYTIVGDEPEVEIHSVRGVFQHLGDKKLPLLPSLLSQADNTYNLTKNDQQHWELDLNLPDAFAEPRTVSIHANGHNPAFSPWLWHKLTATPNKMELPGVTWSLNEARQVCALAHKNSALPPMYLLAISSNEVVTTKHLTELFYVFTTQLAREFDVITLGFRGVEATSDPAHFTMLISYEDASELTARLFIRIFEMGVNHWFGVQHIRLHLQQANPEGSKV